MAELDSNPEQPAAPGNTRCPVAPAPAPAAHRGVGVEACRARCGPGDSDSRLPEPLIRPIPQPAGASPGGRRGLLTARDGKDLKEEGAIQGFSLEPPFQVLCDPEAYLKQVKMELPSLTFMISPEPPHCTRRWDNEAPKG